MASITFGANRRPKNVCKTISRMIHCVDKFNLLFSILIICFFLCALSGVISVCFVKTIIDDFILSFIGQFHFKLNSFGSLLIEFLFVFMVGLVSLYVLNLVLLHVVSQVVFSLQTIVHHSFLKIPVQYYDLHGKDELLSIFTKDIEAISLMFSHFIPRIFFSIIAIPITLVAMVLMSWQLTFIIVISIIFLTVAAVLIRRLLYADRKIQTKNDESVDDYIGGMLNRNTLIRMCNDEENVKHQFSALNYNFFKSSVAVNKEVSLLQTVLYSYSYIEYIVVFFFGVLLIVKGLVTMGSVASFCLFVRFFLQPFTEIYEPYTEIMNALSGAERIFSLIDQKSEFESEKVFLVKVRSPFSDVQKDNTIKLCETLESTKHWAWKVSSTKQLKLLKGDIQFENVFFDYRNGATVLRDISFHVVSGSVAAFVGCKGSGKTTVLNLLTRSYRIEDGNGAILIDGIPIADVSTTALRKAIYMVFQDTPLFQGSIRENILYGNVAATDDQIKEAACISCADSFIKNMADGYETLVKENGSNLSHAQRQMIALARAVLADPPILILDEATSCIDIQTEMIIKQRLSDFMTGRTVLIASSRLRAVRDADVIFILHAGHIVEQGVYQELFGGKK